MPPTSHEHGRLRHSRGLSMALSACVVQPFVLQHGCCYCMQSWVQTHTPMPVRCDSMWVVGTRETNDTCQDSSSFFAGDYQSIPLDDIPHRARMCLSCCDEQNEHLRPMHDESVTSPTRYRDNTAETISENISDSFKYEGDENSEGHSLALLPSEWCDDVLGRFFEPLL